MSRSRHHGCGRACTTCNPKGPDHGPDRERQELRAAALDADLEEALLDEVELGPCGCGRWYCDECFEQCLDCGELTPRSGPAHVCEALDEDRSGDWGPPIDYPDEWVQRYTYEDPSWAEEHD